MRSLLWIATKSPVPPLDGGRRVLLEALMALTADGWKITLVFPAGGERMAAQPEPAWVVRSIDCKPRPYLLAALLATLRRMPVTIARHSVPRMRRAVTAELEQGSYDAIVCEQLQALSSVDSSILASRRILLVLRAQNVESDLWRAAADLDGRRPWLRSEAEKLERWEGAAVRSCDATHALTDNDRERLEEIAGRPGKSRTLAPVFPSRLPAGPQLVGDPPVVVFGSRGWLPNRDGATWFLDTVWPHLRAAHPEARLHIFGLGITRPDEAVIEHTEPSESQHAFPENAVLAVPLRIASGLRIKILEAWARGVPVIATERAATGLELDGSELLLFDDGPSCAHVLGVLQATGKREAVVGAGRRRLQTSYSRQRFLAAWKDVLADTDRGAGRSSGVDGRDDV